MIGTIFPFGLFIQAIFFFVQLLIWCFRHTFYFASGAALACLFFDYEYFFPLFATGILCAAIADWLLSYSPMQHRQAVFGLTGVAGGWLWAYRSVPSGISAQILFACLVGIICVWEADLRR